MEDERNSIKSISSISKWMTCLTLLGRLLKIIIGPFRMYGLYKLDLILDILQTSNLYNNCHDTYGSISLGIIVFSYVTTVLVMRYDMKKDWKFAIAYPFHYR